MDSMMHDVMRYGTGARPCLRQISPAERTTNDYIDACSAAINRPWSASPGASDSEKTRPREDRVVTALPIWMSYMAKR